MPPWAAKLGSPAKEIVPALPFLIRRVGWIDFRCQCHRRTWKLSALNALG